MKKVKFLKYLCHEELTGDIQRVPDEILEVSEKLAAELEGGGFVEVLSEPKKPKAKPVKVSEDKIEVLED